MSNRKKLFLASCIGDLDKEYSINESKIRNNKVTMVCSALIKLKNSAEESRNKGDEETSYVYYMKFFNVLNVMKSMPDYEHERKYFNDMIGGNSGISRMMDITTEIKDSLLKRYSDLETSKQLEEIKIIPPPKLEVSPPIRKKGIDSFELKKMLSREDLRLLIIDCREKEEYEASRIKYICSLNIPKEVIIMGMSASKLGEKLDFTGQRFWKSRVDQEQIVLVDYNSEGQDPARNSTLWILTDILENWDPDINPKAFLHFLIGGYKDFQLRMPSLCHNPNHKPPDSEPIENYGLGDVEYPNIDKITMKDENFGTPKSFKYPDVDRSSKANAIKNYDRSLIKIREQQLELADKQLKVNKEMLAEAEKESQDPSSNDNDVFKFKMMQVEAIQRDYKSENESLREELEHIKKKWEQLQSDEDSRKAAIVAEMEATEKMKLKELEREKINQELDKVVKKIEVDRSKKPDVKRPQSSINIPSPKQGSDGIILSPNLLSTTTHSVPRFDRNEKPSFNHRGYQEVIYNIEDFSPVYGKVERGLTGLKNLGNTCYMNSIIQCLSSTTTLTRYFLDGSFDKQVNSKNKTQGRIVRALASVVKMLWNGECRYISSKQLKAVVGETEHMFYGVEQQDSHEFLVILIDLLHSDLQTIPSQSKLHDRMAASEKAWLEYTKSLESFILRIFYGQIKSTVKCKVCQKESYTFDTFSNLSLELPQSSSRCQIEECLNLYFSGELIIGWNCPNCKEKRDAIKKLDISKLPPVLVIHLKRFYADNDSNKSFKKRQNYVDFPLNDLEMLPYVARTEKNNGSNEKHKYNLYSVSNHYGTMESGHYTAFCKSVNLKKWFKFDDHTVSHQDISEVRSSAAYILFYTAQPEDTPYR